MHTVFNPVVPYLYLLPTVYLFVSDIANPELFVCGCRTWICLDIAHFYEEHAWPACLRNDNSALIAGCYCLPRPGPSVSQSRFPLSR